MIKTIASHGELSLMDKSCQVMRRFFEDGLPLEALQPVITSPEIRRKIVNDWMRHTGFTVDDNQIAMSSAPTLSRAIEILGVKKVVSAKKSSRAFKLPKPKNSIIRYDESDLIEASEDNKKNGRDWRLVWVNGISLRKLQEKFGTNPKSQPCFYKDATYWQKPENDEWAEKCPEAGYYLLDFAGRFGDITWDAQEKEVATLGDNFERANEAVFTEACFVIFLTTGVRIAEDWYHWGNAVVSGGYRVYVGSFGSDGWSVNGYRPGVSFSYLRVAVARKLKH
jgi:hypothetical protein